MLNPKKTRKNLTVIVTKGTFMTLDNMNKSRAILYLVLTSMIVARTIKPGLSKIDLFCIYFKVEHVKKGYRVYILVILQSL